MEMCMKGHAGGEGLKDWRYVGTFYLVGWGEERRSILIENRVGQHKTPVFYRERENSCR